MESEAQLNKSFAELKSQKMKGVYAVAGKVAATGLNVLICGESGCGKNTLAEYIHSLSQRRGAFLRLNPASFTNSEENFEKNLLDYFKNAHHGTLLIDDVSYCSLVLQNCILKICRDIEEGVDGVAGLNVRMIGVTTRDLHDLALQRRFRKSLADRFVVPIDIPPLRERKDDIASIVEVFANGFRGTGCVNFAKDALDVLISYNWPGNLRELESVLKYAVFHAGHSDVQLSHLPTKIKRKNAAAVKATVGDELYKLATGLIESGVHSQETSPYDEYLKAVETPLIKAALDYAKGNKSTAAKLLKINRNTVSKKINDYGIE